MIWLKKGKIFNPAVFKLFSGCTEFAQSPQTLVFDNFVRIYFSTRKKDAASSKYLSCIDFVDFDEDFKIINSSNKPIIPLGEIGSFDEHGIFPINILRDAHKIYAYTCGWSRRVSVSVETSTGLAESHDNGLSFAKIGTGPVLSASLNEPMLVGDSFVRIFDNTYHMWYIFGQRWIEATETEPPARVYKIAHAVSENGIDWKKEEGKQIIADVLNQDECQALPTVIKIGEKYHMYFCYRYATDFRVNPDRGYRLGYAWSYDLTSWNRDDASSGISLSKSGWDSTMMCYPHLFEFVGKYYLLYNGNDFGKYGFGLAELQNV